MLPCQSFRELKKSGGEKLLLKHSKYLDFESYKSVMKEFQSEGGAVTKYLNPENPIGFSVFQLYNKAAIKQLFWEQQGNHGPTITNLWEHHLLWHSNNLTTMMRND